MIDRKELIRRFAAKGYTKKASASVIDDLFMTIMEAMSEGEDVRVIGFGTFTVETISDRDVRNIGTGERITIPSHKSPKFVPGNVLKRVVREGAMRL